jgi:plastocyanin
MTRLDLTRLPFVRSILVARGPQLTAQLVAMAGLMLVIIAGLLGTPVGSRNPATVLVWIAWWAALMIVAVPFFGRLWCGVCPLPLPGEWLQRGALLGPRGRGLGLGLPWPRRLRGLWLQNAAFVLVALFSLPVLTQPRLTALLLIGLVLAAIAISLIFERRSFCRYLCPVGGFIGLYAQAAPLEVRVRDPRVCAGHTTKTCYTGSADGYGCPWQVFPGALNSNVACGVCLECLRTCPLDNVALQLRPIGADLQPGARVRLYEVFKSLVLIGSALVYAVVLLGPWSELRAAAADVGSPSWLAYAAGFLLVTVVLIPGLFLAATRLGVSIAGISGPRLSSQEGLRRFAPALIPLGLAAWAAFSLGFVLANVSYVLPVLSDPIALGWDLLGGFGPWTPAEVRWGCGSWLPSSSLVWHGPADTCVVARSWRRPDGAAGGGSRSSWRQGCYGSSSPKSEHFARIVLALIVVILPLALVAAWWVAHRPTSAVTIHAQMSEQGGWLPGTLYAGVGSALRLRLISDDVMHGFAIGRSDAEPLDLPPGEIVETTLTFDQPGTYTYYCTRWCGPDHWRMRGVIEVAGDSPAVPEVDEPLYMTLGIELVAAPPPAVPDIPIGGRGQARRRVA